MTGQNPARRGYGIELDPRYCDVIVRRMAGVLKVEAVRAATGKSFAEIDVQTLRHLREAFIRAANRQVTVTDNGTKIRMSAIDAMFHRLVAKALSGDYRSIKLCHDWLRFDINEHEEWQIHFAEMLSRSEE